MAVLKPLSFQPVNDCVIENAIEFLLAKTPSRSWQTTGTQTITVRDLIQLLTYKTLRLPAVS